MEEVPNMPEPRQGNSEDRGPCGLILEAFQGLQGL